MTKLSRRTTRPLIEVTTVVHVPQEKMTLSLSTAPVLASTFSAPKNFWRAEINALSAAPSDSAAPANAGEPTAQQSASAPDEATHLPSRLKSDLVSIRPSSA